MDRRKGLLWSSAMPIAFKCAGALLTLAVVSVRASTVPQDSHAVPSPQTLSERVPIEATIKAGASHQYRMNLRSHQFVRFLITQRGIELTLKLIAPSGKIVADRAGSTGAYEPQRVLLVTEEVGSYTLALRPQPGQASGRYEVALAETREAQPADGNLSEADTLVSRGNELFNQDTQTSLGEAIDLYQKALALWRIAGDREAETRTLLQIGRAFTSRHDVEPATHYLDEALAASAAAGDRVLEAAAQMTFSDLYLGMSDAAKGLEWGQRALELSERTGAVFIQAGAASNIGIAYLMLGDPEKQVEYGERAVALNRTLSNPRDLASALNNLAATYDTRGEYDKALPAYREALALEHAIGDRRGEATALSNVGLLYWRLGRNADALASHQQALAIRRQIGDRRGLSFSLNHIGTTLYSLGRHKKALEYFIDALQLERAVQDRGAQASTLGNIAVVNFKTHDLETARDRLNEALSLWTSVQNLEGQSAALGQLGRLHLLLGDTAQAEDHFKRALTISRSIKYRPDEIRLLHQLAVIARERGDLGEAQRSIEASLAIVETSRASIAGDGLRSSFFATTQELFDFYIDLLMRLHSGDPTAGYDQKALEAAERARARGLLDALIESRADIRAGVDPALFDREKAVEQRIDTLAQRQTRLLARAHSDAQAGAIESDLSALLVEYEELKAQIRSASPKYAALTQPSPLTVAGIQAEVAGTDTVLLEYALGDDHSYLWAVTATRITSFTLPKRRDIESLARRAHSALTARNRKEPGEKPANRLERVEAADRRVFQTARALSHMLIGPVASIIRGKRIVVVASGALQYVPFAVLPEPGGTSPLAAGHEIVSLPSASALAASRQDHAGRPLPAHTLAVLADPVFDAGDPRVNAKKRQPAVASAVASAARGSQPDWIRAAREAGMTSDSFPRLAYARQEAGAILALVPSAEHLRALDFQASRATATDVRLAQYRIIHFATHGLVNSAHPELSGVALSMVDDQGRPIDGYLRLHHIYNLNLPADLVVLSACQTALGRDVKGEGLVSLTRGFMYAGASRVVASLWSVDDQATADLMKMFYQGMLGSQHLSPAAALRSAQVSLRKQERWRAPYYWAGFVLQGEYR